MSLQLAELSVRNFKAFGDELQNMPMSKITLIYGPNSSGKSSIIQALLLMKQSDEGRRRAGTLASRGQYVDLGGFATMVNKHDIEREIGINIKIRDVGAVDNSSDGAADVGIDTVFHPDPSDGELAVLKQVSYHLKNKEWGLMNLRFNKHFVQQPDTYQSSPLDNRISTFEWHQFLSNSAAYDWDRFRNNAIIFEWDESIYSIDDFMRKACNIVVNRKNEDMVQALSETVNDLRQVIFNRTIDTITDAPPTYLADHLKNPVFSNEWCFIPNCLLESLGLLNYKDNSFDRYTEENVKVEPLDVFNCVHQFLHSFSGYFKNCIHSIAYLGSVLDDPQRYHYSGGQQISTVGHKSEHTFDLMSYYDDHIATINNWFENFQIPYTFEGTASLTPPNELSGSIKTVLLTDKRSNTKVTLADVGFGISQILPVIVEGIAGRARIICADHPEVHLHPRLQAEIADLMIETRNEKQWIVETHSELLARRIQTRIAQGIIDPSEVSVLYVAPGSEGSTISILEIDEDGEWLTEWPHGFFDDSTSEIIARYQAGE